MKKTLLLIASLFIAISIFAQSKQGRYFSTEPSTFMRQVEEFLLLTPNKVYQDNAKALFDNLSTSWNSGSFSSEDMTLVMNFCEEMYQKRLKAFPFFYDYFRVIDAMTQANLSSKSVDSWLKCTNYIFRNKQRRVYTEHISFSYAFFTKGILNKTGGTNWHFRNANFELVGDTNLIIDVKSTDLICSTAQDSAVIHDTKGVFNATTSIWTGKQGSVDWQRYGFDKLSVYALLNNYSISVKRSEYTADSVTYFNKTLFGKPLMGTLKDKPGTIKPDSRTDFPQFTSYEVNQISNYYKNIDYQGNVFITGSNFNVIGNDDAKAILSVNKKGVKLMELQSMFFKMYEGKVTSDKVSLKIFLENDTIRHPYLGLQFDDTKRKLFLFNPQNAGNLPFTDTYHGINIYFDALNWIVDSDEITFQQMESQSPESRGYFASLNYFRKNEFDKMKGLDVSHPIYKIAAYLHQNNTNQINLEEYAAYAQKSLEQCISMFKSFNAMGYMEFDPDTRVAAITPLFYRSIDARRGSLDYDIIKISSHTVNWLPNMRLNLNNYDILVNGVQPITLSDVKQVNMVPDSGQIVLKSNRSFVFAGKVNAGLFEFYSHVNTFNYDEFWLDLPDIDSISFYVKRDAALGTDAGQQTFVRVKNVIADLSGILMIDNKNNRAGSMQYADYPKFICRQESYVYFDKKSINEGSLTRDKFSYIVEPFEIDSLMTFTTDGLHFPGRLVSGGIFPDIVQPLAVMSDYSLGFDNNTKNGYDMYNGKGKYYNDIHLSNRGFWGSGTIRYYNATYESKHHKFYFDDVVSQTSAFAMTQQRTGNTFPQASGSILDFHWHVSEAYIDLATIQSPIKIFDKTTFFGKTVIRPNGIVGSGLLLYAYSSLSSEKFVFDYASLVADESDFVLKNESSDSVFLANNYKTIMNFETNRSVFNYLGDNSNLQFPVNMFACTLDEAEWDMGQDNIHISNRNQSIAKSLTNIDLKSLIDIEFDGSRFVSLHPEQDSLTFYCLNADYNLKNYSINARDVKIIKVGNVAVFPGDGNVSIGKYAAVEPLTGATIIGDVTDRLYTFYQANVNIYGKNNYRADGYGSYTSSAGIISTIFFPVIEPIENGRTRAIAHVAQSDNMMLSPNFTFYGDVLVNMDEPLMHFNGNYRMTHLCVKNLPWLKSDTIIDPANIQIPIKLNDSINSDLYNGLYFDTENERFLVSMLSEKTNPYRTYDTLNHTQGVLAFDAETGNYTMQGKDGYGNPSHMKITAERCLIEGEGNLDLGMHTDFVDIVANGKYNYKMANDSLTFLLTTAFNLPFDGNLASYMSDSLTDSDYNTLELDLTTYMNHVKAKMSENDIDRLEREVEQYGHPRRVPSVYEQGIVLSDLAMKWSTELNSFVSVGQIGVANVFKNQVNMYVDGHVQIKYGRHGAYAFTMYLSPVEGTWFFIHYENGIAQLMSSSEAFNRKLIDIKEKNRSFVNNKSGQKYEYVISTIMKVKDFLSDMDPEGLYQMEDEE